MRSHFFLVIFLILFLCGCGKGVTLDESETNEPTEMEYDKPSIPASDIIESSDENIESTENDIVEIEKHEALDEAIEYLNYYNISKCKLKEHLELKGFSEEIASYAVDNCNADWKYQALVRARKCIELMPFSHEGVIEYLENIEEYTHEEAVYASDNCCEDWNKQALSVAKNHLVLKSNREQLISSLKELGFTDEQAKYAADNYR